jgi:hypothetical protein
MKERSMIMSMPTKARLQHRYDHRLRNLALCENPAEGESLPTQPCRSRRKTVLPLASQPSLTAMASLPLR